MKKITEQDALNYLHERANHLREVREHLNDPQSKSNYLWSISEVDRMIEWILLDK